MPRRKAEGLGSNISRRAAGPGSGLSSCPLGRLGHGVSSALTGSLEWGLPLDKVNIKGAKAPTHPPSSPLSPTNEKQITFFIQRSTRHSLVQKWVSESGQYAHRLGVPD